MMRAFITSLALFGLYVGGAYAGDADTHGTEILGRAGSIEVSVEEIHHYLETLPAADRATLDKDAAKLAQAVRTYLAEKMVLKSAHDSGFDQQPEIAAKLQQAHDVLLKELYLQSVAKVAADFPAESDMRAFYDANKSAFIPGKRYNLSQIYIAAGADGKTDARTDDLMKKLAAKGSDFTSLAHDYSDTKSEAEKGGEIGWVEERALAPEIKQAVSKLAKGSRTQPVRMADGWHIVMLNDVREAGTEPLPFAEIKTSLAQQMRQQLIMKERQGFVSGLIDKNGLVINELALSQLTPALKDKPTSP